MDFEKIKQWMEVTQKYQNGKFWEMVFEEHPPEEVLKDTDEQQERQTTSPPSLKYPQTDIYMTETDVILLLEIPGARKEEIYLSVSGMKLFVKGVIRPPMIQGVTILNERLYGEFQREIELPEPTESKDIIATFENGLLIITYPRRFTIEENIMIR